MHKKKISLLLIVLVSLTSTISAFGISSDYWKGKPLEVYPGESRTIELRLQNMVGDQDVTLKATLKQGKEIARIEERDYLVKSRTKDTSVPIEIAIPEDAKPNKMHEVKISFEKVNTEESSGVSLGTEIENTLEVLVIAPTKPGIKTQTIIIAISAIALAITTATLILRRRKTRTLK